MFRSLITFAGFTLACSCAALGQQRPWQKFQMPAAAEVKTRWVTPAAEYGPEPYYGLNGPVTLEVVQRDLDAMQKIGFRAVTVQFGYGSGMEYLSPEYMTFFKGLVAEAKKRDMRVWIVDDAGYPSGFAGGKFTTEHPELRMQALAATNTVVAAGEAFDRDVAETTVAVTAISASGEAVQIPVMQKHVHWQAPAGTWTVSVVEHVFRTSPTRSDTNPKRVKDGSQSLEDYLDPAATAQYIAFTHEAYRKAVGDEFGKTILGFRGDEPDYSISGLPWTPKFFDRFREVKGYDVRPYVALFLQKGGVPLSGKPLRAKADYYDVFAQLFRDGFFKPQGDWCAANGMEYQVHLNHEEMEIELAHSEGDFFRDMRFVQVPGIDSIWHQIWTDTVSDFPRLASSAAHVYGHPRSFTESFAAYRPLPDAAMARYILNEQLVRGVNLVETMYFPSSATVGRGGPMAFMKTPEYAGLMHYTGRLSYLMSMGRPAADVALLLPSEGLWMGDRKTDDTFVSAERMLSEAQVDFDVVDEDALGSLLPLEKGAFLSASGNRYRTVLVPPTPLLPDAVAARLRALVKAGGHVVFLGSAPSFVADGSDLEARMAKPNEFAWAQVVAGDLPPVPTPPAQPPTSAPEAMTVPAAVADAVKKAVPAQAITLATPDTALRFTQRRLKDATVVLLFNESAKVFSNTLRLSAGSGRVEIWDPETGEVTAAKTSGKRDVALHLEPYATEVLVVY